MELSLEQKLDLYRDGYVRVPGAVPPAQVDAALKAINHSIGSGMRPEEMQRYRGHSFCPELQAHAVITDLMNRSPAWSLAESALGRGKVKKSRLGQIALRFPGHDPHKPMLHLDRTANPDGSHVGEPMNFAMLVMVMLSEVPGPDSGSLVVWPGTHRAFEAYFRRHGAQELEKGLPEIPLPEPVHVTGQPGDVVLAHFQLGHSSGPNSSPRVRYAAFFRIDHADRKGPWRPEAVTDIWLEWEGMREVAADAGALDNLRPIH